MGNESVVDLLASHRTLGSAPRAELEWLAARGERRTVREGETMVLAGLPVEGMFVLFTGHTSIRVDKGAGPRKVMEWRGGDVTGLLPYSRLSKPPGHARAEEDTDMLFVSGRHFPEMIRECHEVTAILVHVMVDRARAFTSSDLHVEKILSLGRLAAGLAHELNNPASAVARSAATLRVDLGSLEQASQALSVAGLSAAEASAVDALCERCAAVGTGATLSPIDRADREDALVNWLDSRGLDAQLAESLADSDVPVEAFENLGTTLTSTKLEAAVRWITAICGLRRLAGEIETAASRIHDLVGAVKGFTYLDQATTPKPVDIARGLADTLTVLRFKARAKSVVLNLTTPPGLPEVDGYGGELNQVWSNLIDNALDAVPAGGQIDIQAEVEDQFVVVRVVDNGPGIPEDVRMRVFEPFFTTKPVGDGTGLGLDIARRIVSRHDGSLEFDTRPGRTEFRVLLPVTA